MRRKQDQRILMGSSQLIDSDSQLLNGHGHGIFILATHGDSELFKGVFQLLNSVLCDLMTENVTHTHIKSRAF